MLDDFTTKVIKGGRVTIPHQLRDKHHITEGVIITLTIKSISTTNNKK